MIWLLVIGYFTFHLVQGERGIISMWRLQSQLAYSESQLAALREDRKDLEKHVQLLRPDHIDQDMLDEQARSTLGYAAPNEIMILIPKNGPAVVENPNAGNRPDISAPPIKR